ncbi:MAG: hypothetical protein OXU20_24515 [Myxococcales bacterium]|nr:hypothetical protein [Myxococcales bacterium]
MSMEHVLGGCTPLRAIDEWALLLARQERPFSIATAYRGLKLLGANGRVGADAFGQPGVLYSLVQIRLALLAAQACPEEPSSPPATPTLIALDGVAR